MIFGVEETPEHPPDVEELAGFLQNQGPVAQGASRFLAAVEQWDKESRPDATALAFAEFLSKLPSVIETDKVTVEKRGHHLLVDVSGWLKYSQRPLALRTFFGLTDPHGHTPPEHWPYVLDSIKKDNALFYSGPTGAGDCLSLAAMSEALSLSQADLVAAGTQTQRFFLGVLSGGAYSQIGTDLLEVRSQKPGLSTDLMLLASAEDRPQLSLGMLRYLDRTFTGEGTELKEALTPFLGPTDVVVFNHHTQPEAAP